MNERSPDNPPAVNGSLSIPEIVARGAMGGTLMGLANLVPGISGGTMLVVAGIFTLFVAAIADITSLRITRRAVITLASVVVPAGLSILLLAGVVLRLVEDHRWLMYSLFIGWTLGGVPTVWAMALGSGNGRPQGRRLPAWPVWAGATAGLASMVFIVITQNAGSDTTSTAGGPGTLHLFAGGLVAAGAMVLPGLSGGYLLLLLGLYVPILDAIVQVRESLQSREVGALASVLMMVIPLGIGVVVGVVGVSHLVRWLLQRFERVTMGVLLGLLVGAFLGLYPFERPVAPEAGTEIRARVMTEEMIAAGEQKKYWPTEAYAPTPMQLGVSLLLIGAAATSTLMVARVGRRRPGQEVETAARSSG